MPRALSVKVPTSSLIALLEDKIATIKTAIADYPRAKAQYKEDVKSYKKSVLNLALAKIASNPEVLFDNESLDVSTSYRNDVQITLDKDLFELPEAPEQPEDPSRKEWIGKDHTTKLSVLEKTLAVLKLTTQEEVSASTYNSVMELL
jgi:hypothetical protein